MILETREGLKEWNIASDWLENRRPGVSAFIRVKNEAEFMGHAVASILSQVDEVIIAIQGQQKDATGEVAIHLMANNPDKVRVLFYPFDSHANGPGHDQHPADSVFDRSFFYNWTLARTRFSHALKWDGDMVALDGFTIPRPDGHVFGVDAWKFKGVDLIANDGKWWTGERPHCAAEARLFRVTQGTHHKQGARMERLVLPKGYRVDVELEPQFLHFKWAKPFEYARQAWPEDWRDIPHFQKIDRRSRPVNLYTGAWPDGLLSRA